MTPAARVQAAIELLHSIIEAAETKGAPADRLIADYFRTRRFAGSKDRRAIRELVYQAIRLCGPVPQTGREAMLALADGDEALIGLFDGSSYGPATIGPHETPARTGIAAQWQVEALAKSGFKDDAAKALLSRAPLDIRVNALKTDRETIELPAQGELLVAPQALRFPFGTQVEQWEVYRQGAIEIQDHASQLVCEAVPAAPGDTVLDLCAGAGGKTLGLAARFGNAISLIAADTNKRRLGNCAPRAAKAGAQIDHTILLNPGREMDALTHWRGAVDHVLVDAPCSGSGTWRRNPESRWRLTPNELDRLTVLQAHVLDLAVQCVRPGGSITYVTCSVFDHEGADQIAAFLARHPGWSAQSTGLPMGQNRGQGIRLDPYHHETDGFFIAILRSA